jgi:hypothetical protein
VVKALLALLLCNLEAILLYRDPQAFASPGPSFVVGWTVGTRYLWWFAGRNMVKALLALLLCSLEAVVLHRGPQALVPPGPSLALLLDGVGWTAGSRYLWWFAGRNMVKALLALLLCSLGQLFCTAMHKHLRHLALPLLCCWMDSWSQLLVVVCRQDHGQDVACDVALQS